MLPNRLRKPEELKDEILTYSIFRSLIESYEDRWNSIINMILKYESGDASYEDAIPVVLRIMSLLGQEMDRTSTRQISRYKHDHAIREASDE